MGTIQFAFFDVDETLINMKSMFSFRNFYWCKTLGQEGGEAASQEAERRMRGQIADGTSRDEINRLFWHVFKGCRQTDLQAAIADWHQQMRQQENYYIQPAIQALREHQRNGVQPVFVSGSSCDILQPLARDLDVRYVLANQLEILAGNYTGEIMGIQTIGEGKRRAVQRFLERQAGCAADCYGYGDHISDLPMLELVGFPRVIAGDPNLMGIAQERGWPILNQYSL